MTFLSVSGNIFFNSASGLIAPILPPGTSPDFVHDLIAGTSSSAFETLSADMAGPVRERIAEALRNVWIFNLAGGALSLVLSLFLGVSPSWQRCTYRERLT